jgi:hypothetical protein
MILVFKDIAKNGSTLWFFIEFGSTKNRKREEIRAICFVFYQLQPSTEQTINFSLYYFVQSALQTITPASSTPYTCNTLKFRWLSSITDTSSGSKIFRVASAVYVFWGSHIYNRFISSRVSFIGFRVLINRVNIFSEFSYQEEPEAPFCWLPQYHVACSSHTILVFFSHQT